MYPSSSLALFLLVHARIEEGSIQGAKEVRLETIEEYMTFKSERCSVIFQSLNRFKPVSDDEDTVAILEGRILVMENKMEEAKAK